VRRPLGEGYEGDAIERDLVYEPDGWFVGWWHWVATLAALAVMAWELSW